MRELISKFALLIQILVVLYLILSGNLFSWSPFVIVAQVLAIGLAVWARVSFQKGQFSIHAEPADGTLLAVGPYRFIRHPMYAGALILVWSSILGHLSVINVVVGLFATVVAAIRIMTEEHFLQAQYPGYTEYSAKTKRIVPFVI